MKPSLKTRVAEAVLLTVLGSLLAVVVLELAVRWFCPQEPPSLWLEPDARYGHVMKKHFHQDYPFLGSGFVMTVNTNALGFRDEEPAPYQEGIKTILFLGDSFTFGHGVNVPDRFDTRLKELCRDQGRSFRFLNVGVSAWGTLQETRYVRDHLDLLRPDIVVLTFCENDPYDDAYFLEHGVSFDHVTFPGKLFLRKHFHLFRLLQHRYLLFLLERRVQNAAPGTTADADASRHPEVRVSDASVVIPESYWDKTFAYLREFQRDFLDYNPKGVLLIQATQPTQPDIREHLKAFANDRDIFYVDLAEAADALTPEQRRLPYDGHWSPAMHNISAQALLETLMRLSETQVP